MSCRHFDPSNDKVFVCAEADKAAAEAGVQAFRSALGMTGMEQPPAGLTTDAGHLQSAFLAAPDMMQGKKLRLGKVIPPDVSNIKQEQ